MPVPPRVRTTAHARISIRASNVTVDFSGSIVECWMNDTCIFVGDASASQLYLAAVPMPTCGCNGKSSCSASLQMRSICLRNRSVLNAM